MRFCFFAFPGNFYWWIRFQTVKDEILLLCHFLCGSRPRNFKPLRMRFCTHRGIFSKLGPAFQTVKDEILLISTILPMNTPHPDNTVKDEILLISTASTTSGIGIFQTVKDEILRMCWHVMKNKICHFKPLRMRFCGAVGAAIAGKRNISNR